MPTARAADADLAEMSIEELSQIEVSSVSKKPEPLNAAPAAIYVITADDIRRSGATSLPEMLRLAPNLQVAQFSSGGYAITARGFNGNFANKLLVLIDGRSVYSPLYAGVYWDMQDVMPEDVERIEVISGPGATLWGANAVNGVINIVTRGAADTQGGFVVLDGGNHQGGVRAQYGARASDTLSYRLYVKAATHDATDTTAGGSAHDGWYLPQGGFRFDWTPGEDKLTLQGDVSDGAVDHPGAPDEGIAGRNILARWSRPFASGELQVQAYYDRAQRISESGDLKSGFALDTYDLDVQHHVALGSWNDVVWGGGYRVAHHHIFGNAAVYFDPESRTLGLGNVFVQDTLALAPALKLTLGMKLEDDPYSGLAALPDARLSWQLGTATTLWAAVSRAIRAPTPFDRDLVDNIGALHFIAPGSFDSEKLIAYEAGSRFRPTSDLLLSVTGYYHQYDDLRTLEPQSAAGIFPLVWSNFMEGHTYGLEAWANYQVMDSWRLAAGTALQHKDLRFKPGASQIGGLSQAGDDPDYQVLLRSSVNPTRALELETELRIVGPLPNPAIPGYVELNGRVGWTITDNLELALVGNNLLHARHREIDASPASNVVTRSVFVQTRWRF